MNDLKISSVELVASPRPVPQNGAPNSQDFNAFQNEVLADLADFADLINESLLPMLETLPETAAQGLDGNTIYADRSKNESLFRDAGGNRYTVSEVLSSQSAIQKDLAQQMTDLSARVLALQTRLATTQQNDLRASVQSLQDSYAYLLARMSGMLGDVATQGIELAKTRKIAININPILVAGNSLVDVTFDPPFVDNTYVVTTALETSGGLTVQNFIKKDAGAGLIVNILADATSPEGVLHILAQAV